MEIENIERTIEDECATPRGKFGAKLKTTVGKQDVYDILIEDFLSKRGPRGKKVSAKVTKNASHKSRDTDKEMEENKTRGGVDKTKQH
jgi:hypothetical protein